MKRIVVFALALTLLSAATLPAAESKSSTSAPAAKNATAETGYWINTKSHIRHNKSCRYYGKGKNAQACGPNEGKACKICGG